MGESRVQFCKINCDESAHTSFRSFWVWNFQNHQNFYVAFDRPQSYGMRARMQNYTYFSISCTHIPQKAEISVDELLLSWILCKCCRLILVVFLGGEISMKLWIRPTVPDDSHDGAVANLPSQHFSYCIISASKTTRSGNILIYPTTSRAVGYQVNLKILLKGVG